MVALATVVVLAVAGTTSATARLNKAVTLSLDGRTQQVSALGDTVGDVLASEGIEIGEHDVVAPGLDEEVADGSQITVRFGRPLELSVDGETTTLLGHRHRRRRAPWPRSDAASTAPSSRPAVARSIDRDGLALEVVTPKKLTVKIGDRKPVTRTITALTVEDALDRARRQGRQARPRSSPRATTSSRTATRSSSPTSASSRKRVKGEAIDLGTVEQDDDSMYAGETHVVARPARPARRNVTYRLIYRNGKVTVAQGRCARRCSASPLDQIVKVGTKAEPRRELRRRQHRLGRARAVRVGRQLGDQHRQRLLRRPAVQPRHLAVLRRHRPAQPEQPRDPDRDRDQLRDASRRLRRLAGLRRAARPAALIAPTATTLGAHVMTPPPVRGFSGRRRCVGWPPSSTCAPPSSAGRTSSSTPTPCAASCASRGIDRRRRRRSRSAPGSAR